MTLVLVMLGVAHAEPLCLNGEGLALLTDASGETLLGGEGIEAVFAVRVGELYAAGRKGDYRLYDAGGSRLSDIPFSMIDDMGDCLVYRQGDRYGAMDAEGNRLLPADWTQLVSDGAGGWLALDTDPRDETADAILRVDAAGVVTPTGAMTAIGLSPLVSGRMPVMTADGRFGAVDRRGEIAIQPTWRYIGPFNSGLAKAADDSGLGLIDADGEEVIPTIYDWLERGEGLIACGDAGGVDVYTPDGLRLVFSVAGEGLEASVVGGCLALRNGDGTRLYDSGGNVIYESDGSVAFAPGVDGQLIASDGGWGEACAWLVAPDGTAASGRYQRILPLCPGRYATMAMEGIEYYSADLGRVQTSWNYESLRWGLMDGAGNELLPAAYLEIVALSDERLLLTDGEGAHLADIDGNILKGWIKEDG